MDTKITNKQLHHHFEYDWIKYILLVIVSVILWVTLYSVTSTLKNEERLEINCYFTPSISADMDNRTKDMRTEIFGDNAVVKEIDYVTFNDTKNNSVFDSHLATGDLTVMSKDYVENEYRVIKDFFFTMDEISNAYATDTEWAATMTYLKSVDALYEFHVSQKMLDAAANDEEREAIIKLAEPYEGKPVGIWLNKLPRVTDGCFFEFPQVTTDAEGNEIEPYRNDYILLINKVNLTEKSGGGNKGVFNAKGQDASRTEAFDFIKFFVKEDGKNAGFRNYDRFIVAAV